MTHEMTWALLNWGNLKREIECLLREAEINAIRTNYVKAKIDNTQKNCKCRLCDDGDQSECSKLAWVDLIGSDDQLRTDQEIKMKTCWQIVYEQSRICPRKWDT